MLSRRQFIYLGTSIPLLASCRPSPHEMSQNETTLLKESSSLPKIQPDKEPKIMITRPIPNTGEMLPVIGLGTWQTLDVNTTEKALAPLKEVVDLFAKAGGKLIDSSPMYGASETVVGTLLSRLALQDKMFLATKVWTRGLEQGKIQMQDSMQKMGTKRMDLMQIHNLLDWRTHLKTLQSWKESGLIRYIGITHYSLGAFDEMEQIIQNEKIDFVQLPYSIALPEAEKRLIPVAKEKNLAIIVMRPFEGGTLFRKTRGQKLPPWVEEFDCQSWAQFFLKWILSNPAITCPIPATSKAKHLVDNMAAGLGKLPTKEHRQKMKVLLESF